VTNEFTNFMERTTGEVPDLVAVVKDPEANHAVNKAIAGLFKPGFLPAGPQDGDAWSTPQGVFTRQNGKTVEVDAEQIKLSEPDPFDSFDDLIAGADTYEANLPVADDSECLP
jgi:hypothetical protein